MENVNYFTRFSSPHAKRKTLAQKTKTLQCSVSYNADMNIFGYVKRLRFQKDIAKLKTSTKEISIKGDVKNVERLHNLRSLRKVYLVTTTQDQFDRILPFLTHITELTIYEVRCTDLSGLNSLTSLEKLELEWNTKIEKLWDMSKLTSLRTLSVTDFTKLTDISEISEMTWLENLEISGGINNKLSLKSVRPLSRLKHLKSLDLSNVEINDESSILPLVNLKQLEKLNIPNRFPTEEIARLSVELPNTKCQFFVPYVKANFGDGKDIMLVGKGKPRLSSKKDKGRIEKYIAEFEAFQNKYR